MLIRRAIVLGCVLAVVGAACSGSGGSHGAPPTTRAHPPAKRNTTTTSNATSTTTPAADSLSSLILSNVPGAFKVQPDSLADTGPTNLQKAALDDVLCNLNCDAHAELTNAGFVDGYQRQWTNVDATGSTVDQDFMYLYEFRTPQGAAEYASHWQQTLLTSNQGPGVLESFTPAFVPGAVGLKVADQLGSTGVAIFSKGPYAVQAVVNGGPKVDQSGPATQLAAMQFARLP